MEWLRAGMQNRLSVAEIQNPNIDPNGTSAWSVFNIHVGYDFKWGYATIGIQNILDESYRVHGSGIDGNGRVVLLSMQLGF